MSIASLAARLSVVAVLSATAMPGLAADDRPQGQGGNPPANAGAPTAQGEAPAAKGEAPTAQGQPPAAQGGAPAAKGEAPAAKDEAPPARADAPAARQETPAPRAGTAPASPSERPAEPVSPPVSFEPRIQVGLWEVVVDGDSHAMLEEQMRAFEREMADLAPEVREEMLEQMREMLATEMRGQRAVEHECVTEEDVQKGLARMLEEDGGINGSACRYAIDWHGITGSLGMRCADGSSGVGTVLIPSPREVASHMRIDMVGASPVTVSWRAVWLGPDCSR